MAAGEVDILVGTHALFQADVQFKDLAFAVIDEQHRFGVHQRLALQTKGGKGGAGVLVMTATPIPRTLLMTHYGDLDVSKLTEKPAGRKPIVTKSIPGRVDRAADRAPARAARRGRAGLLGVPADRELGEVGARRRRGAARAPLPDLRSQCGRAAARRHAGQGQGRDHGGLRRPGMLKVLVATTVIEVGVDVPNANIMVIEHAERFGLAQLHQLRGRVGRGTRESFCMLLHKAPLGEAARQRLEMMEDTEDGFKIAEKDLELARRRRGAGRAPERACPSSASPPCPTSRSCWPQPATTPASCSPRTRTSPRPAASRSGCCSTCSNATRPCACSGQRSLVSFSNHVRG